MVTGEALVGVGSVVCLFKCLFGLAGAAGRRVVCVLVSVLVGWCWCVGVLCSALGAGVLAVVSEVSVGCVWAVGLVVFMSFYV